MRTLHRYHLLVVAGVWASAREHGKPLRYNSAAVLSLPGGRHFVEFAYIQGQFLRFEEDKVSHVVQITKLNHLDPNLPF